MKHRQAGAARAKVRVVRGAVHTQHDPGGHRSARRRAAHALRSSCHAGSCVFGALPALRLRGSWPTDSPPAVAGGMEHLATGGGPRSSRLARATRREFRRCATSGCSGRPPRVHSAHAGLAKCAQRAAAPRARHFCWWRRRAAAASIERRAHVPLALAARAVPAAALRPRGARPDDGSLHGGPVARQPAKLTRTSRGLRTVRTSYAYQPPACCTYQRRRAACPEASRTVRTGYAYQPRACRTYHVPCTVAPQAAIPPC